LVLSRSFMFAIVQRERMYHEGQTPDYETAALPAELRRHLPSETTIFIGKIAFSSIKSL
jgi:hypothetical protein